jgi:ATP-binding cassette, subfamily B, bacterial HlyB/CyaB
MEATTSKRRPCAAFSHDAGDVRGLRTPLESESRSAPQDTGLLSLTIVAKHYRIPVEVEQIRHELGLGDRLADGEDLLRAARRLGLKARLFAAQPSRRLATVPTPVLLGRHDGTFIILAVRHGNGVCRIIDPQSERVAETSLDEVAGHWSGQMLLVTRRAWGAGVDPKRFSFGWFVSSVWRYRRPLSNVLVASFFIQGFALVTPMFFQVVIDKVLLHDSHSTLTVVVAGLVILNLFDIALQHLRAYTLNHTTSRIDAELGSRLFGHLLQLPLGYFETRPTGQTAARVRELESIRSFLTGQCLTSAIDVVFSLIFALVLFAYSPILTLTVLCSIPFYGVIATLIRPALHERVSDRFNCNAASQQFLVESVVGIQTLKAAAVEPILRAQWDEKLAAYVQTSFRAVMLAMLGQNAIQCVNKVTTALVLFLGAQAVISGELSVGGFVAFNMIMGQMTAPILRLSQLWQDFQQVQISVERLGDILNSPVEPRSGQGNLPPASGAIRIKNVGFRYRSDGPEVLQDINLSIPAGQALGVVGPSGSGKSTLTKLIQRFYLPERGQIFVDDIDIGQTDPAWLRRQIGVVLQENTLFNRTIHENIALAAPTASRDKVIAVAKLAGADEFIARLPLGYDTPLEERGANLSGGQRQRIAIARALFTQPRILILDEATSALDYESERIIQLNMHRIRRGRTVIIIAHRLATVRNADRIIAIDDGRIVEDGTHSELLRRPHGVYARLWRLQGDDGED